MMDVTVRGAGIFGLSIAWVCLKSGARVRVIDPNGIAAGSSGGIVGALAPHVPENWNSKKQFQFESLLLAEEFWAEVARVSGDDPGYARAGRVQPVPDDSALALARSRQVNAKELWCGEAAWTLTQSVDASWAVGSPTGWYIHDTLSARIHPRRACHALAKAITATGGEICLEGPDKGAVVWATGVAGLASLGADCPRTVGNGVKGQAALLRYDAGTQPQLFADTLHFVPHNDGTVAIGSTSERDYSEAAATDGQLDALIDRARHLIPALADAPVIERWAGVRPRSRSRAPMLGPWPDRPGHFVANGGFKIGFGVAPKVAEVTADLILQGRDEIPKGFEVGASF
ncbi:MAG: FAD-dependent oxidoreductase [Pseudomonadota bacterium]